MSQDKDDVFRPVKKSINPSEFDLPSESPAVPPQNTFEAVQAYQEMARNEVSGANIPQSVSGSLPPAIQQALQKHAKSFTTGGPPDPDHTGPHMPPMSITPNFNAPSNNPNNDALSELLATLNTQTYEKVELPSRGKFYTEHDTPTDGVLHLRPMTGQEESILTTTRYMAKGQGIEMILKNCLREKHINPEKLLTIDRTYLIIYLRTISYGHLYDVTVKCPACSTPFDYEINLNLPVQVCEDNFDRSKLTRTLPSSGFIFTYRLPTGFDESAIQDHQNYMSRMNNKAVNDSFIFKASTLIESIGNGKATVSNRSLIQSVLEKLTAMDVNYIRNVFEDAPFGVDTTVDVICPSPNCMHEFDIDLPFGANFFFPRVKT